MNTPTIIDFITDPALVGGWLKKFDMTAWLVFHSAVHGLPMDTTQTDIFRKCTGRNVLPISRVSEMFAGSGRRSGKSMNIALEAVYFGAIELTWQQHLAPGQRAIFGVFAVDRRGAKEIKNYCSAILHSSPLLRRLVETETQDEIILSTGCIIEIRTASFRTSRGPAYCGLALDEISFMRDEATSSNPASEIIASVRPALLPGCVLFGISSVYNRSGPLFDQFQKHFAKDSDDTLFWLSDTPTMNPGFSKAKIQRDIAEDPARARAEYFSQWRDDLASLFDSGMIDNAVIPGRDSLPFTTDVRYLGAYDPSGGRRDSAALAIVHKAQDGKIVIDYSQEWKSPHEPQAVIVEAAAAFKAYGISQVTGDRYGGEFPVAEFRKHGITYKTAEQTASECYLACLPLFSGSRVELPDSQRLRNQLLSLMRRTSSGGRDQVIVGGGVGDHCDLANAVCLGIAEVELSTSHQGGIAVSQGYLYGGDDSRMVEVLAGKYGTFKFSRR